MIIFHKRKKHFIYLIHGIAGNKSHFWYTAKALRKILSQKDQDTKFIIKSIQYDTGHDEKNPYDFAMDVAYVINKKDLNKEDKISLIMHSQGGLVGSIWMFQSIMGNSDYSSPETIEHLDAFITLGTPFWGAKVATWGSQIKMLVDRFNIKVPLRFGKSELEQMSFGSDTIFDFRQALIDPDYQPFVEHLKKHVRFLNIAGMATMLNPFGTFVSGTKTYEDDGAVPIASSRFNFIYVQSFKDNYVNHDRLLVSENKEIDIAPYEVVEALHRSPMPEMVQIPGIAQITKACIGREDGGHPTYPYIWKHILGEKLETKNVQNVSAFLIDINLRLPDGYQFDEKDFKISFLQFDGLNLDTKKVIISSVMELYSNGFNRSQKYPNQIRFYYTGNIKMGNTAQCSILLTVSGKNLKQRLVELNVRKGYSSFVDINLEEEKS